MEIADCNLHIYSFGYWSYVFVSLVQRVCVKRMMIQKKLQNKNKAKQKTMGVCVRVW